MKAVVFNKHGGPEVLECAEVPDPTIDANEVLVEVKACSLNHLDVWARGGLPGIEIPLPHILGNDIAGVVRGVGELVSWVRSGDEVMLQPGISCGHCLERLAGRECYSKAEKFELGRSCCLAAGNPYRLAYAGESRVCSAG